MLVDKNLISKVKAKEVKIKIISSNNYNTGTNRCLLLIK